METEDLWIFVWHVATRPRAGDDFFFRGCRPSSVHSWSAPTCTASTSSSAARSVIRPPGPSGEAAVKIASMAQRSWVGACSRTDGCILAAKHSGACKIADMGEEDYEVEAVLDQRGAGRGLEYLVKWKGWPSELSLIHI